MKYKYNKWCALLILFIFLLTYGGNTGVEAEEEHPYLIDDVPEIVANGAIVVDVKTGYVLYEKNPYEKFYPASITKIMTAILAIENLNYEDTVTFSHDAVYTIEPGSSSGYLREGEQITVEQCLQGLMLISGNDIANGLAEAVSGTMDSFAVKMTDRAKELGSVNTHFANAHGLDDEEHYSCPYDMALFARYAYNNMEQFRKLISTERVEIPPTPFCDETRYWHNSNRMIQKGTEYYDEDCRGGKTGYTTVAGGSLVTFHDIGGRIIMIVLMNDTNSVGAYIDTMSICECLHDKVDKNLTDKMDKSYEADMEKEHGSQAESDSNSADGNKAADRSEEKAEEKSNPLVIIIFIILIVFIIYYIYIIIDRRNHFRRRIRKKRVKRPTIIDLTQTEEDEE